jgi:hypothetical protein
MPTIEEKSDQFDAHATAGSIIISTTALSIALLLAQYSFSPVGGSHSHLTFSGTEATLSRDLSSEITSIDLFRQINRVYDDLLRNQVELDADSRRVLYEHLWDLYT